jgi:hypothetical protein
MEMIELRFLLYLQVPPSSEVILQPGDLIGFTLLGIGTIAVNHVSPSDGYRYAYRVESTVPTVGQDYDVPMLTATDVFSYSIEIGKLLASMIGSGAKYSLGLITVTHVPNTL